MASDATKAGSLYLEIRAEIKKLSKDLAAAEAATKQSVDKMHKTIEKGIDFGKVAAGAAAAAGSIYAAFRAVGQAIESAKVGSMLDKQAKSFSNLSDAAGTSSKRILDSLKQSSQGLVAESDLMAAAGKAMLMSIPADKISELMKIAAATSKMTGQSITEAFNDITMGVARQSRMILDNLGIIVNVDDANKKYAKALGTTADALDEAQKKQAFMNAVLEAGADMIKRLGSSGGALDGVNKLIAAQADLWAEVNKTVATFLDKELSGYASALKVISDLLKGMRGDSVAVSKDSAWKEIEILKSLEAKGMAQPGTAAKKEAEFNDRYLKNQMYLKKSEEFKKTGSPYFFAENFRRDQEIKIDPAERQKKIDKDFDNYLEAAKKASEAAQKLSDDEAAAIERSNKAVEDYVESLKKAAMELNKIEDVNSEARFVNAGRLKDSIETTAFQEEQVKNIERIQQEWEAANDAIITYNQHAAEVIQDVWADVFFDAMTGKLKSLEDYFNAFYQSVARMASQYMSQILMDNLTGKSSGISDFFGMFGGGGSGAPMSQETALGLVRHSGGGFSSGGPMRSIPSSYFATAPRLHGGLMADEYPAVLQKGEQVIPKGKAASSGGDTYNVYNISAIDSQSFVDAARRSGAVPMLAAENINQNGGLRRAIVTRAR